MNVTMGRIVNYTPADGGTTRAALVTNVHSATKVDLAVFLPGCIVHEFGACEGGGPGEWAWPVREAAQFVVGPAAVELSSVPPSEPIGG